VVDTSFVITSLDPQAAHTPTANMIEKAAYDTLLTSDGLGSPPRPSLAKSYRAAANSKRFTFQLRKDVTFADGTPLTSADVVFSFRRLINLRSPLSGFLAGVTVSAPDKYTVVMTSASSNPALLTLLTIPTLVILNSKLLKENGGTDAPNAATADHAGAFFNSASAGSGPYVLSSYSPNNQVILQANPRYWGKKPRFKTVVIRNMQAPTQLLNVQRGTNEVAIDLAGQQAASLRKDDSLQVHISPSPNVFFLALNQDPKVSATAANPHIRKAIRLGLDYPSLLKIAGPGSGRSVGVVPEMILGAIPHGRVTKPDLAKAKAQVRASGISNPSLELAYPSDLSVNGLQFGTISQAVAAQLEAIGISIKLTGIPTTTFLSEYGAGKLEAAQVYWIINYPDPADMNKFLPGGSYAVRVNWDKGSNPAVMKMYQVARATPFAKRRAQRFQAIQRTINAGGPWIPMFEPPQAIVGSANLTNLALNPSWTLDLAAVGTK
jgi:peptide/nickel transport system substrate-binding protein